MFTRSVISKILILALSVAGVLFSLQVRLVEDVLDMLPGKALHGDIKTLQQLGMINRVFISLETESPSGQELLASAGKLGEELSTSPLLKEVFYRLPDGYEFRLANDLKDLLPVLTTENDLGKFSELIKPAMLRQQLRDNYLKLNTLAGLAMTSQIRQDPLDLTGVILAKMATLRGGMKLAVRDGFFISKDGRHCLLWAESNVPLTVSANALAVQKDIDQAMAASLLPGVKARIIGPLAHTVANAETIRRDLTRLLPAAALLLVFLLMVFFRDMRALLVVAIPFFAVPPAVALLAAVHGTVSAMALGFGIVLLGIAVDFAVHIYVGCDPDRSRVEIPPGLRSSLLMAFTTTITVFAVLLLSKVAAHRQMALLAIFGLSWALFLSWQLVPSLAGRSRGVGKWFFLPFSERAAEKKRWRSLKLMVWVALLASGFGSWPLLHYNGDLRAFDVPSPSVRSDEQYFAATWGQEEEQAFIVATGSDQGKVMDINDMVYAFLKEAGRLKDVQSLSPVLPGPRQQSDNVRGWRSFWEGKLPEVERDLRRASVETGFTEQAFQPFIDNLGREPRSIQPDHLLEGPLRPFILSLFREIADPSGKFFLAATMIPEEPTSSSLFEDLAKAVPGAVVLSNSRWRQQVEAEIKSDIIRLSTIAAILVILICAIFFRRVRQVFAVLAPVLSALSAMALFSLLTSGELNLMHVLMGIMVIGLSVDYGIFIAGACLKGADRKAFAAVSICAISTLTGFGVLGFAEHPALQALGVTVLAGITAAWPTALFLTPLILGRSANRGGGR